MFILNWLFLIFDTIMKFLGRHRIINDRIDMKPYLERYYLFLKDRGTFPFNIFLHKFIKSDPDDLHDHPWNYRTLILLGGYWEYTEKGKFWRGPLSYRFSPAESFHRIELDNNIPYCWTLFMPGTRVREWGFKTKDGWIHNENYYNQKILKKK